MNENIVRVSKKYGRKIVVWTVAILICGALILPSTHKQIGNIFFGGVTALYNVNLAQFFFTYASYPIVGKPAPFAHHQLSRTYFIKGQFTRSIEEAYKEIEEYPEHWRTYYLIGLVLGFMDREEEAIEAFGKFIEHAPLSWAARNDRAWLQFRIGDIDGALETIEPVTLNTVNPWVLNTYGTILYNKGEYARAQEVLESAKQSADRMTEEEWGRSYPGNDPRVYGTGLSAMRKSIESNLELVKAKQESEIENSTDESPRKEGDI